LLYVIDGVLSVALGGFQRLSLRKDFPMTGCVEVRYDDEQTRFVYEPGEKAKPQPAMTNASRLI
jgi:hypothetical protein